MRLTEATSSDPAVLIGLKPASPRETDGVATQFASVLSATRRSSNRLLDMLKTQSQARQQAADQRERRVEDRTDERVDESQKKANRRERVDRPRRSEQLRSMARDRAKAAEQVEEPAERTEKKVDSTVEKDAAERSPERPPAMSATGEAVIVSAAPVAAPAPQTGSVEPQGQGQIGAASIPSGAAKAVVPGVGENTPASASAVQGHAAAAGLEIIKPVSPAGSEAGAENTTGGKPAEAAAPGASTGRSGSEGEFKSLLQHLARTRGGEPLTTARPLAKTKGTVGRAEKPLDTESVDAVRDLARVVRSRIGPRESSMTMTMSPAELGRLRIDVRTEDGALTVQFQTETAAGHDAIKAKLDQLRSALEQQGIRVDRIDVQYAPPAPPVNHGNQSYGQPAPDGGQWQMPSGYGGSAGQAGQSFDQPRHEADGSWLGGQEAAAPDATVESVSWNWLRPGVDLVA